MLVESQSRPTAEPQGCNQHGMQGKAAWLIHLTSACKVEITTYGQTTGAAVIMRRCVRQLGCRPLTSAARAAIGSGRQQPQVAGRDFTPVQLSSNACKGHVLKCGLSVHGNLLCISGRQWQNSKCCL